MLGNPGSNPLELFWDVVDSLDQRLDSRIVGVTRAIAAYNKSNVEKASRAKAASSKPESAEGTEGEGEGGAAAMDTAADVANVADAEDGEEPKGFVIMPGTTFEEMQAVVKGQEEVKDLTEKDLQLVYYAVGHCFFRHQTWNGLLILERTAAPRRCYPQTGGGEAEARPQAAASAGRPPVCAQEAPGADRHQYGVRGCGDEDGGLGGVQVVGRYRAQECVCKVCEEAEGGCRVHDRLGMCSLLREAAGTDAGSFGGRRIDY
jgi:hypothetical protein